MSSTIVIAPGEETTQVGLSGQAVPQVVIPSSILPLTPPLTFATRFQNLCHKHLQIGSKSLPTYCVTVADGALPLRHGVRQSLQIAITKLLAMTSVRFECAIRTIGVCVAVGHPFVVHIGSSHTVLRTHCRTEIVEVGLAQGRRILASALRHRYQTSHNGSVSDPVVSDPVVDHLLAVSSVCVPDATSASVGNAVVECNGAVWTVGQERTAIWQHLLTIGKSGAYHTSQPYSRIVLQQPRIQKFPAECTN